MWSLSTSSLASGMDAFGTHSVEDGCSFGDSLCGGVLVINSMRGFRV